MHAVMLHQTSCCAVSDCFVYLQLQCCKKLLCLSATAVLSAIVVFIYSCSAVNDFCVYLQLLLERGANPNAVDIYGMTPLSTAIDYNLIDMLKVLVSKTTTIFKLDRP